MFLFTLARNKGTTESEKDQVINKFMKNVETKRVACGATIAYIERVIK